MNDKTLAQIESLAEEMSYHANTRIIDAEWYSFVWLLLTMELVQQGYLASFHILQQEYLQKM